MRARRAAGSSAGAAAGPSRAQDIGVLGSILVASVAGSINVLATNPVWTIVTKQQNVRLLALKCIHYRISGIMHTHIHIHRHTQKQSCGDGWVHERPPRVHAHGVVYTCVCVCVCVCRL